MSTLARSQLSGGDVLAAIVVFFFGLIMLLVIVGMIREAVWPRQIGNRMKRFFGPGLKLLQAHEKSYPGWDLGSLSRAVASFVEECCEKGSEQLGSVGAANSIQPLIPIEKENALAKTRPSALTYERLPVDVEREESFVSNVLYFATVKADVREEALAKAGRAGTTQFTLTPGGGARGSGTGAERVAIFMAQASKAVETEYGCEEEVVGKTAPAQAAASNIQLSIACRSKEVADYFFAEIERRRQELSIYRGKVIEPVINGGGIVTVGFRKIRPLRADELELPAAVRELIDGSIVAFYQNREALRDLGVELKRGVVFHSPPGTGKTSICLYLAGLLSNFTVCFVSGRRLLYPRELCRMARYLQPAMLIFEDIDLIANERDSNQLSTVLGELMNQIDECEPAEQVLFIMNTNSLQRLERAVRNRPGRVDQIVDIPLPDAEGRKRLLRLFSKGFSPDEGALERVAAATDGATPATLKEVVKRAAVMAVARAGVGRTAAQGARVRAEDLLLAYEQVGKMRREEG
jgi:hypothetical protein